MARILLKTTIPYTENDWHIGRFSLLTRHLREDGHDVTARDRIEDADGNDVDLIRLAAGEWHQLWLFAVDDTGALTARDCDAIRLRRSRRATASPRRVRESTTRETPVLATGILAAIDEVSRGPLCRRASNTRNSSQDTLFSTRAPARKSATER